MLCGSIVVSAYTGTPSGAFARARWACIKCVSAIVPKPSALVRSNCRRLMVSPVIGLRPYGTYRNSLLFNSTCANWTNA